MKKKKPFFETTVGKIIKFAVGMVIKNQKGIKGTENVDKVDKVIDNL